jgi:lipoyl(octanoyl) transferase
MPLRKPASRPFAANFHLLGQVDFEDCLTAQKRLAYDAITRGDGRLVVLLCEHPPLITVGRRGSREQLRFTGAELAERELTVRYVARGGGCLLHGSGQLAVYVVTELAWHGWSIGDYLRRLQTGLKNALAELGAPTLSLPNHFGLWGNTGLLAAVGVTVRYGVTSLGAYLNVDADLGNSPRVEVLPPHEYAGLIAASAQQTANWPKRPLLSSVLCETASQVRMTSVRAAVVSHLAAAFECSQHRSTPAIHC